MLFSSVYEPVERLEIITSNLRMSKGDIPCQLVANELVDIVTRLRAGMQQMNLHPACDVEDWRKGYPIPFNAEYHIKPMNTENDPEKIILQTMGFRYLGDDGQWQQYSAQVVAKSASQATQKPDHIDKKDTIQNRRQSSNTEQQPKKYKKKENAEPFYAGFVSKKPAGKAKAKASTVGEPSVQKKRPKDDKGGPKQ